MLTNDSIEKYVGFTNKPQMVCPWCKKLKLPLRELTPNYPWRCSYCCHVYKYNLEPGKYYSKRYGKWISWGDRYPSDGVTGFIDIDSFFWKVHDVLCNRGEFDDRTPITNWQCSMIARDILMEEGHKYYSIIVMRVTLFGGGGRVRENGLFWLNKKAKQKYGIA